MPHNIHLDDLIQSRGFKYIWVDDSQIYSSSPVLFPHTLEPRLIYAFTCFTCIRHLIPNMSKTQLLIHTPCLPESFLPQ